MNRPIATRIDWFNLRERTMPNITTQLAGAISALALFTSTDALAWDTDEPNKTVVMVGAHAPNTGYATFVEGVHANCLYQHVYFDASTALGKALLATLMAAKATGMKVRIGYTLPPSTGVCNLALANLM
jgi:hypothetical protein